MSIRPSTILLPAIFTSLATVAFAQPQPQTLALAERPGGEVVSGAVADGQGGMWTVGSTSGNLAPTADAFQRTPPGQGDGFLAHIGPDGSLLYATYLGGSLVDNANAIARDAAGNLYVAGATDSTDFPTTSGAYQRFAPGGWNAFVMKFDPTGRNLLYSTFLGGGQSDGAYGIAVDAGGSAHVVGMTQGSGFPYTWDRCLDSSINWPPQSSFYTRLSTDGASVLFSTCLDDSTAYGVALDANGDAYVVGRAGPHYSPRMGSNIGTFPQGASSEGFLAKFALAETNPLPFSMYIGGDVTDWANGVAVTSKGIYVAGAGYSTNYPGAPPRQPTYDAQGSPDGTAWIMKVRLDGVAILGTTLIDGNGRDDEALALQVDSAEVVHVAGWTDSTNLPTSPDAAQPALRGRVNAWYATAWMPNNVVGDPSYLTYLGGSDIDRAYTLVLDVGRLQNPDLVRSGGAWVGGETTSTDFPSVNSKAAVASPAFVAWFAEAPTGADDPSVWVSSPTAGATFTAPATISITANTYDNPGTVTTHVDFYAGGVLLGRSTSQPYAITWNNVAAGTYSLTAVATNSAGGAGVSTPVSITVGSGGGGGGGGSSSTLPQSWSDADVGAVGAAGSAAFDSTTGTFTVHGAGADVWGTADAFNYVYTPLAGDATIVAHVTGVSNEANWVKAGVMIRGSLSPSSAQAFMLVSYAKGIAFQRRVTDGSTSVSTSGGAATAPYWVKLVRAGNVITAYASPDGASWAMVGSDTFTMDANAYVGLALSSHVAGTLATATFDHVTLSTVAPPPPPPPPPSASEIVLYAASDATLGDSAWVVTSDSTAAGGARLWNPDQGAAKATSAVSVYPDYFEMTFSAQAGVPYHLWVRGKAENDYYGNDSAFVQFSGSADASGNPTFRIGTTSQTTVVLEDCSGCGEQGWGWQDNAYGGFAAPIYFATSGPQTIRITRREDGFSIDQVVISPSKYLNASPGALKNDTTIVPK